MWSYRTNTVLKILHNTTYGGTWYYGKTTQPEENWIPLDVPAIVSEDLWEEAQEASDRHFKQSKRNTSYDYLMQHLLTCKHCGHKIGARLCRSKGNVYVYYYCNKRYHRHQGDQDRCKLPYFPADQVDRLVWGWVKSQLIDPERLEVGLREHHQQKQSTLDPVREELEVVQDELAAKQKKYERLLDLYLDGGITKDMLDQRKEKLESTIRNLQSRESRLQGRLSNGILDEKTIQTLVEFARAVSNRLPAAEQDFEIRRSLVEFLDVKGQLALEDDEKIVHITSVLNDKCLSFDLTDTLPPGEGNVSSSPSRGRLGEGDPPVVHGCSQN